MVVDVWENAEPERSRRPEPTGWLTAEAWAGCRRPELPSSLSSGWKSLAFPQREQNAGRGMGSWFSLETFDLRVSPVSS